ncbi:hypothetical protein [Neptuniibacter sp. QD37_11]|uniref:hypothetical protein n=1 Tax=Neptuniibacter sp. QD37_11 TaxID=3398209 RepID=UPI0039F4905D
MKTLKGVIASLMFAAAMPAAADFIYRTPAGMDIDSSSAVEEATGSTGALIASVIDGWDGSAISSAATLISGNSYLGRNFWYNAVADPEFIGSHGPLNGGMEIIYDAGVNNVWSASSAQVYSPSGTYPYISQVHWFMSRDQSNWVLVGETANDESATTSTLPFTDTQMRYMKIVHDEQPSNGSDLSVGSYRNFDMKILEADQTTVATLPSVQYASLYEYQSGSSYSNASFYTHEAAVQVGKEKYAAAENFNLTVSLESLNDQVDFGSLQLVLLDGDGNRIDWIWDWASYTGKNFERCNLPGYSYENSPHPLAGTSKTLTISRVDGFVQVIGPLKGCTTSYNGELKLGFFIGNGGLYELGKEFKITVQ